MRVYPQCRRCMLGRAMLFSRGAGEATKNKIKKRVKDILSEGSTEGKTTIEVFSRMKDAVEELTGDPNPMRDIKEKSFRVAAELYPTLEAYVLEFQDDGKRFRRALMIAVAGNILEVGTIGHEVNLNTLEHEFRSVVEGRLAVDDTEKICARVKDPRTKKILYVTDNVGELYFDKVFIKELLMYANVSVAPLSRPAQDDATVEDVRAAGLNRECRVVPRGNYLGLWLNETTPEFRKAFKEADLVFAKGMACYETIVEYPEETRGKVALLMKVKCKPVAEDIGEPVGSTIIKLF